MYQVYLVDDDLLILEDIINMVPWMDNGFEVAGYQTDPVKAIDEIVEIKPDVVFCDLRMPVMDGNELIRRLKEEGVNAEFVMISAYDSFRNVREFFQQAGFDYILKPVNNDDIQLVLEELNNRLSARNVMETSEIEKEALTNNPEFNKLILYVEEHFMENITLETLTARFGFARNYICGLFQRYYNKSLTSYLTELRMEHAKKLLLDEKKQIKEVALSCGYSDYHHFFRVFKKYFGLSPKEMQDSQL